MPQTGKVIQSYRQLYRQGLHAVQFASPARHTLRHQLNQAFRNGHIEDFNQQKVNNTVLFLKCAARKKGLEHRILKTFLHVRWWDLQPTKRRSEQLLWKGQDTPFRGAALNHFKITLKMFNQSMATCLPEEPLRA